MNKLQNNDFQYNALPITATVQAESDQLLSELNSTNLPTMIQLFSEIKKFQDSEGRLTLFPSKRRNKVISLLYLATKFESDTIYTEKQVNEIIECNHTFQDKWLLRRELINHGLLCRLNDGSQYWVSKEQPRIEEMLK